MRGKAVFVAAVVLFCVSYSTAGTWTTIPVAHPRGISGTIVVGTVWTASEGAGAGFYDIANQTITRLEYPGGTSTVITGVDGRNMTGYYQDGSKQNHQFLYNGTDWVTLHLPYNPSSIGGDNIVGGNWVYNITIQSITTLTFPGASNTTILDIDGDRIVGGFVGTAGHYHGFLYDGTNWIELDPALPGIGPTLLYGISGNYAIGLGTDTSNHNHGLLYNISTQSWTVLDYPGAIQTDLNGIDGYYVVGDCEIGTHGYSILYTIPEPATLLLLGLGVPILSGLRRKH